MGVARKAGHRRQLVHIGFARGKISRQAVAQLAPYCQNDERVDVQGQIIWADYAAGVARSKLTSAVLDRVFGASVTMRNVKTLRAIAALLGGR